MEKTSEIFVLGLNHNIAPVEVREKVAYSKQQIPVLLKKLLSQEGIDECIILSTCNRSEIYVVADVTLDIRALLQNFFQQTCCTSFPPECWYFFTAQETIRHLFRVAAGLDSMFLGEPQILGQVKEASNYAAEACALGVVLDRLFSFAISVGKRARSETGISEGAVGIAYAAVELAQRIFPDIANKSALILGAGNMGELTARYFAKKGIGQMYLANRTLARGQRIAAQVGASPLPFAKICAVAQNIDMIIGATGARDFILTAATVQKIVAARITNPLVMIDIAVPRDFDPDINCLNNVFLHNIDNLEEIVQSNLAKRHREIPAVENIIHREIAHFLNWYNSLQVKPTIVALRQKFETIRQLELQKYHNTNDEEFKKLESVTRSLVNKILHLPMVQLKRYSKGDGDDVMRIEVARELFGIGTNDTMV